MKFKRANDQIAIKTTHSYVNLTKGGTLAFIGALIQHHKGKDRPLSEFISGGRKYTIGKGRLKRSIRLSCYEGDNIVFSRSYLCSKYIMKKFIETMKLSGIYDDKQDLLDKCLIIIDQIK